MKSKRLYIFIPIAVILIITLVSYVSQEEVPTHFSETVKIALRSSGNQLLIANNDTTSLISPIRQLEKNKYQLSFETNLSIDPDTLVQSIKSSFEVSEISNNYIVEVIDCTSKEVSYSYLITAQEEKNVVPCKGRNLPLNCYAINVLFIDSPSPFGPYQKHALISLIIIGCIGFGFVYDRKIKEKKNTTTKVLDYAALGDYKFYKDQHKLVKEDLVIKLTAKECELLNIFSLNQNQIVKKEVLIKEVWEDHGVIVGRSLDAFISRIRKKFKDDPSINIVNIHGVGYKLEVS